MQPRPSVSRPWTRTLTTASACVTALIVPLLSTSGWANGWRWNETLASSTRVCMVFLIARVMLLIGNRVGEVAVHPPIEPCVRHCLHQTSTRELSSVLGRAETFLHQT